MNPRPLTPEVVKCSAFATSSITDLLSNFERFCKVDRNLAPRTLSHNNGYPWQVRRLLESVGKHPSQVTAEDIRSYLIRFKTKSPSTYANVLKALKIFFREFLKMPEVVESFKFPKRTYAPKTVPSKEDLRRYFDALDNDRDKALFLMYATSGLRRNELLSLTVNDLDLENRTIIPKNAHNGTTKSTWGTCFNVEAQTYLKNYLVSRESNDDDRRLLRLAPVTVKRAFEKASQKSGIKITPQVLRDWFCDQLGLLGVPDRYVDAMCGRTPKSVLARHYSDFAPQKLKTIYDKADLRILS